MRKREQHADKDEQADGDRQFVTALDRGLDVLRAFRPDDRAGLGNRDIARRTGLPNSTVSRLTYTLLKTGYLLYDGETGRYRMGMPVLSLGYACLAGLPIREAAQGHMQALADRCGEGVQVALGGQVDHTMIYLAAARSRSVISLQLDVGSRISLARSAMGRAWLAGCDPKTLADMLDMLEHRAGARDWPQIRNGIADAAEQIAARGFYASYEDWQPGVHAVAVPFRNPQDGTLLAFNLGAAAGFLPREKLENDIGPALVTMAASLGHVRP